MIARRSWLRALAALSITCAVFACADVRPASNEPNVIVIMADDLGWADVGYHGSAIATPHIDSLASGGIRLERFYSHAWCSPTRASFLTGHFPGRYAWSMPASRKESEIGIDPAEYTIAERFRDAGYQSGLIGKWHQGTRSASHPNRNGFDYFYGLLGGYVGFYAKNDRDGTHDWQRNGEEIHDEEQEYGTRLLGRDARRFVLERDPSRPFFLFLSFHAPHFPQQAPDEVIADYRDRSDCEAVPNRCGYMAQVDVMDREIGSLLGTLEDENVRDDTLIVFLSDNGGTRAFGGRNTPLRGQKAEVFEGGIRVPAVMNWPGVVPAGASHSQRMRVDDLYATLEAAAGLAVEAPDPSSNMWPGILSGRSIERVPFIFMNVLSDSKLGYDRSRAVLGDPWKLVVIEPNGGGPAVTALYDVIADPGESTDLSAAHGDVVSQLRRVLQDWEEAAP